MNLSYSLPELLKALESRDGLIVTPNEFTLKRYFGVFVPSKEILAGLPEICGISAAAELKALILSDIDERLTKYFGLPWDGVELFPSEPKS